MSETPDSLEARLAAPRAIVRRMLYPPLLAALFLAILLVGLVFSLISAARWVEHADQVIAQITRVRKLTADAALSERSFLISGDPNLLLPYQSAKRELPDAFDALSQLVSDRPAQVKRLQIIQDQYQRWDDNAVKAITSRQHNATALPDVYDAREDVALFNGLRIKFGDFFDIEAKLRSNRIDTQQQTAEVVVAVAVFAALMLCGVFVYTIRRQIYDLSRLYEQTVSEEQQAREQFAATLLGIGDGVLVTDEKGIVTLLNPVAELLTGWTTEEARGKDAQTVFDIVEETTREVLASPVEQVIQGSDAARLPYRTILRRRDGSEVTIEENGSPIRNGQGRLTGVALIFRDISERRIGEAALEDAYRREALVNEVGAAIRNSPLDSEAILRTAVAALGKGIGADRCYYARYDQAADFARLAPEWHREGMDPITGDYPMSRFSINRDPQYKAGRTQAVEDVRGFALPGETAQPSPLESLGLRSIIRVPVQVSNEMTAIAVAMSDGPRKWTENEIRLVETVGSQIQSALSAARLLSEERTRAVRESILHRIGGAVLESSDPDVVQRAAVNSLGEALQVDRCYIAVIDTLWDSVVIGEDWRTDGLPSLTGQYPLSAFGVDIAEVFGIGKSLVVADTTLGPGDTSWSEQTIGILAQMQVAAMINVPFYNEGRLVAALGVGMARQTRTWTPLEIDLVEAVAAQTRTAIEAARMQQREHTIATQLQDALIPAAPTQIPGMELASLYRPALAEAGVGGDFLDVFPVKRTDGTGDGTTVLVVADMAGKGLAAASQVATVRDMLRCLMYEGLGVADAITRLNSILVDNTLLTGFATLFVGQYEAATRELTYVNCGQEPGLVRRKGTGVVESLLTTGPVLGGFPDVEFEANTIWMEPGDLLALFTDGLTEAGPNRRELLGIEGVAALLRVACQEGNCAAAAVAERLVSSVDAVAQGVVGDDVCLLVGVVQ